MTRNSSGPAAPGAAADNLAAPSTAASSAPSRGPARTAGRFPLAHLRDDDRSLHSRIQLGSRDCRSIAGVELDPGASSSIASPGFSRRKTNYYSEVINWLGMWFFVSVTVLAVIFSLAVGRAIVRRRRNRQRMQMRIHLNRISRTWE